jgi:7 transmembrane sweet-taste receptor of 3 GCPR
VNFVLLLLWNLIAPLEWIRVPKDATDNFDRPLESIASCATNGQSLTFAIVILVVNLSFLILGTFWAYKCRNIATEYNESIYVGLCIVALLQTWTIGLPILVVVRDNPSVSFYVQSGLIFVTSLMAIGFNFVPKAFAARKDFANSRKEVYKEFKRAAILRQRAEEEEDSEREANQVSDPATRNSSKSRGIKVIHNPRVSGQNIKLFFASNESILHINSV